MSASPSTELKPDLTSVEEMMMREVDGTYTTPEARAAYRAGMSTAAAICDLHAQDYGSRNSPERERSSAAAAATCGNAIWRLRDKITVPDRRSNERSPPMDSTTEKGTERMCPECEGRRKINAFVDGHTADGRRWGELREVNCLTCDGEGTITAERAERMRLGRLMRDQRVAAGKTLREAAQELGISPSDLSRIEHGKVQCPTGVIYGEGE